jgi:hypothetical protein
VDRCIASLLCGSSHNILLITMARTALLAVLLMICIALGEASFFKMTLEARTQPGLRRDKHRRYYEDPLGLADTIYSTILTVGGQNYRVIMVWSSHDLIQDSKTPF